MKTFIILLSLMLSAACFSQEAADSFKSSLSGEIGGIGGDQQGISMKVGLDVSSGDFYKISGSLGRASQGYLTVGHVDALLKKGIPLGESKRVSLVLGYSPLSVQSSSALNRTEAILTPAAGVKLPATELIYTFSPLASVAERESGTRYKAMVHGIQLEQDIGEILKIISSYKFVDKNDVKYKNLQNKLELTLGSGWKVYGFYDWENLGVRPPAGQSSLERSFNNKVNLTTAGIGVKIPIGPINNNARKQ